MKACKVAAVFSVGKSVPCLPRRMLVSQTFKFIGTNLGREIFVSHSCARVSHLAKEWRLSLFCFDLDSSTHPCSSAEVIQMCVFVKDGSTPTHPPPPEKCNC